MRLRFATAGLCSVRMPMGMRRPGAGLLAEAEPVDS
jgi:hypothetical protein